MFRAFPLAIVTATLLLVPLMGCDSSGPPLGTVEGTVTLDGTPVPNAFVVFTPQGQGRPSETKTDDSGRFQLSYTGSHKGALIGKHEVTVSTEDITDDGKKVKEIIPAKYNRKGSIKIDVVEGYNDIKLDLTTTGGS